ncbi:MAG TPA: VCBS repeat-containing protein [Anaerolineales bacterium]|nr:VCBS repeat-containing protein [Anaerolineales bacterium]
MVVPNNPRPFILLRWVRITLLVLLLTVGAGFLYRINKCIDGCGPYHHTTSVADLDGDGDLDVLLSGLRHETETTFWAGSFLWTNQGGGKFTPQGVEYGGPSAAAGDVDGDGDSDVTRLVWRVALFLNQGGEQDGVPGEFKQSPSIAPQDYQHDFSSIGTVLLVDLNNDGRLDVLVSYCCSTLVDKKDDFLPFLPWVWINTLDETGSLKGQAFFLNSLGDLPMRPTLGDLDGDGYLDIYAASLPPKGGKYESSDRILLNDGSGSFVDSGRRLDNPRKAGTAGSGAVALDDLDGDGDLDALVATAAGAAIWINQGGAQGGQMGILAESGQHSGRGHIEAVFLADFDADGDPDALAAGKAQATIWWNDGQAGFRDSGQRLRYTERHGLAVGDFNDDGYPDVFSAASDTEFHLWLNQGDGRLQEGN